MKIYTGNFANVKKYIAYGLTPISIAISARYFNGLIYRPLNPDRAFLNDNENEYIPKYMKKLSLLNPEDVFNALKILSNGKNIVLLCHEGEDDFCHRHLVAEWLEKNLHIKVLELGKMKKPEQKLIIADLV